MCFQMANSVAQLGFGHIADRWRPRVLLIVGPLLAVAMLPLDRAGANVVDARAVLCSAASAAPRSIRRPRRWSIGTPASTRLRDVVSHHQRHAGAGDGAAGLRAVRPALRAARATPLLIDSRPGRARWRPAAARPADRAPAGIASCGGLRALRPYARPLTLLYLIVVLRTLTALSFSTFMPVMLTRRGMTMAEAGTAASIYLLRVGAGGFFGGPLADRWARDA